MRLLRPLPRQVTRIMSVATLLAWGAATATLVSRTYLHPSTNLATDLGSYTAAAQWRGVYYRGEKIGFTVRQITPAGDGFEVQEDGQLQMSLLGAITPVRMTTKAVLGRDFDLRRFSFALDPGTGATTVDGRLEGRRLELSITTRGGTRAETRELGEAPVLAVSLGRRLAAAGLTPGATHRWLVFDPATLAAAPVTLTIGPRESVDVLESVTLGRPGRQALGTRDAAMPAFRVELEFSGLRTTAWVTDTGDVVREESPLGLLAVRESEDVARRTILPRSVQFDLLAGSAIVPQMTSRLDDTRAVRRLRMRLSGVDLSPYEIDGAGQRLEGDVVEVVDPRTLGPGDADPGAPRHLSPEPLIESDDRAIVAEAERVLAGITAPRARAERLTRHVNALLEKKPTVSLPSAREVLRARVGDCNEHTALYVALARAAGLPARIAVGLTYVRGAFYYHAWPEVYIDEGRGRGLWLPVDPTFNEFPATAARIRLARGGLDRQSAILPLLGRLRIAVLDVELAPNSTPVLVGRRPPELVPLGLELPQRDGGTCWSTVPGVRR